MICDTCKNKPECKYIDITSKLERDISKIFINWSVNSVSFNCNFYEVDVTKLSRVEMKCLGFDVENKNKRKYIAGSVNVHEQYEAMGGDSMIHMRHMDPKYVNADYE